LGVVAAAVLREEIPVRKSALETRSEIKHGGLVCGKSAAYYFLRDLMREAFFFDAAFVLALVATATTDIFVGLPPKALAQLLE
jgi:hypothetical protein